MKPINPFQPPLTIDLPNAESTDEISRKGLCRLVRLFLNDQILALEFGHRLEKFEESDDSTIRLCVGQFWNYYDDIEEHQVCLSKPDWDYVQRLLLALESDCRLLERRKYHWCPTQMVAAVTLAVFVWVCFKMPIFSFERAALVAIPFGAISISISAYRDRSQPIQSAYDRILTPFLNFGELNRVYQRSGFTKVRYRRELGQRRIRSVAQANLVIVQTYGVWLIASPVVLLVQSLPIARTQLVACADPTTE